MLEVYPFFVMFSPLSGAVMVTFSFGFKIISEHNKVVFPALTSKIRPGTPSIQQALVQQVFEECTKLQ